MKKETARPKTPGVRIRGGWRGGLVSARPESGAARPVFQPRHGGRGGLKLLKIGLAGGRAAVTLSSLDFMRAEIHPKYVEAEIRCACGNVIKTRSTKPSVMIGICNVCHPFYTGTQKFVDTAGRVDKFQQRMVKTQAAQAAQAANSKKKKK
jgi:large subunit ribosomal protein L31